MNIKRSTIPLETRNDASLIPPSFPPSLNRSSPQATTLTSSLINIHNKAKEAYMNSPNLVLIDEHNNTAKNTFVLLWYSYIKDLSVISPRIALCEPSSEEAASILENPDVENYFIVIDNEIVGFLLLGKNGNKHEESDWFIAETYVKKEFQNKGIGKTVVRQLLLKRRGAYCLFILKKNFRARRFWKEIFAECEYEDVSSQFLCEHTPEDAIFRMYSPQSLPHQQ